VEVYRVKPFNDPDLAATNLIIRKKSKPWIFAFGTNEGDYIDSRGVFKSPIFLFGKDGSDILIGAMIDALGRLKPLEIFDSSGKIVRTLKYDSWEEVVTLLETGDKDAERYFKEAYRAISPEERQKEIETKVAELEQFAKDDNVEAMYQLAMHHYHKSGNMDKFHYWIEKGISRKHARSMYLLASVYKNNKKTLSRACELFRRLAEDDYDKKNAGDYEKYNKDNADFYLKKYCSNS
jgi:hypothetical protein